MDSKNVIMDTTLRTGMHIRSMYTYVHSRIYIIIHYLGNLKDLGAHLF